jgi:hypothetical protein
MEWVKVNYAESRDVFIDHQKSGKTNMKLIVGEGTHDFDLGDPKDYCPLTQKRTVTGTTEEFPMQIDFEKVA